MSAVPLAFSISMRDVSARCCSSKVAFSWLAISRWVSTAHQLGGEHDVLDVDAPRLDLVLAEVAGDRLERRALHLLAGLDEPDRLERLQRVAEVVADRGLQHLVDEVAHRADHRDHLRRPRVGHVDLHLQVDLEDEALAALAHDRRQLRVEVVRLASVASAQLSVRMNVGTISAAYSAG